MKQRKPRKPRNLYWYGSTLEVNKKSGIQVFPTIYGMDEPGLDKRLPTPAAKRLWKWLKRATEYLEGQQTR
jgi:hypothetical protein